MTSSGFPRSAAWLALLLAAAGLAGCHNKAPTPSPAGSASISLSSLPVSDMNKQELIQEIARDAKLSKGPSQPALNAPPARVAK